MSKERGRGREKFQRKSHTFYLCVNNNTNKGGKKLTDDNYDVLS